MKTGSRIQVAHEESRFRRRYNTHAEHFIYSAWETEGGHGRRKGVASHIIITMHQGFNGMPGARLLAQTS
jgi:hypothetical protein